MFHPNGPSFLELARQGLSSTVEGYDLLAPKFDFTPFRTPDTVLAVVARQVERWSPAVALDVCCGTGAALWALRPVVRERLVGLDFSRGMLAEAARQRDGQPGGGARVELVHGDALAVPFSEAFDLVTSFGAFGHIRAEDEARFVAGLFRALRPGGRFVFVTSPGPRPGSLPWLFGRGYNAVTHVRNAVRKPEFVMLYLTFTLPKAQRLLEGAGFVVETREGLFPRPFQRLVHVEALRPGG